MKTATKNLVILFPGTGYTVDRPLLYYADFVYRAKGYECMPIGYGDCIRKDLTLDEVIENVSMVVSGTKGKLIDADVLKNHCKQEKIKLEFIEGACHSLEILDDIHASIDILKRIVKLYT